MSMVINHNLSALNTYNQLNKNSNLMNSSLQKLSSGYRINSAADDAAGLAISEKMRGQIRGLGKAGSNAQDGISLIQTAEGALKETESILQRMRELSVQAASDTNTDDDRQNIQDEVDNLVTEINNISNTTEFNTKKLLDGSMGKGVGADTANVLTDTMFSSATAASDALTALANAAGNSLGIGASDTVTVNYMKDGALVTYTATAGTLTLTQLASAAGGDFAFGVNADTKAMEATATSSGTTNAVLGLSITVTDYNTGAKNTAATNALSGWNQTTQAENLRLNGSSTVLIGANTGQDIVMDIDNMSASSIGVANLDVKTQASANIAVKVIDTATAVVSAQRAKLGAVQNRLESTINNLSTTGENMTSAESRIRDVDMASEMANYTKLSVVTQAATAMLAQANQQPQSVLALLR